MNRRKLWLLVDFGCIFLLGAVVVFGLANSSDRSSMQWESAFLCMFTWILVPVVWAALWFVRKPKRAAERPGFDVIQAQPSAGSHGTPDDITDASTDSH